MAKNEAKRIHNRHLLIERLFGDFSNLSDDEIDMLYSTLSPSGSAAEAVYRIAEGVAVEFRKKNLPVPEHIQAAILATRPVTSLDGAKPGFLQELVEKLKTPFGGPISDTQYAYRNREELSEGDKAILDDLKEELEKDWKKEKPK